MSFSVNDPFLYLLSAIIVVFVVAQSAFFLVKANRRAQQMGIAAATVRKTILSSALFSIAPAISILVGVITLSNFIGLPFPWLRLSVLGAVTYELPAATIAAGTMGRIREGNHHRSAGVRRHRLDDDAGDHLRHRAGALWPQAHPPGHALHHRQGQALG